MLDFASSVADLLKKIAVLPDQDSYPPNNFRTLLQSSVIDLQKSRLSSEFNHERMAEVTPCCIVDQKC